MFLNDCISPPPARAIGIFLGCLPGEPCWIPGVKSMKVWGTATPKITPCSSHCPASASPMHQSYHLSVSISLCLLKLLQILKTDLGCHYL